VRYHVSPNAKKYDFERFRITVKADIDDAIFDDDYNIEFEPGELEKARQEAVAKIPSKDIIEYYKEMSQPLVNLEEWGKGGKRLIAANPSAKRRASKKIHEVTKGWHVGIPTDRIVAVLAEEGFTPILEDGSRWIGVVAGDAECGSEEAREQYSNARLIQKNEEGKWAVTTTVLHMQWCKMPSGKYEVVCYIS